MKPEVRSQKSEISSAEMGTARSGLDCGDLSPLSFRPQCVGPHQSAVKPAHSQTWRLELALCLFSSAFCLCAHGQNGYTNTWSRVTGGGGTSTGGVYAATSTVGQPETGHTSGGNYTVDQGFWSPIALVQMPGAPPFFLWRTGTNHVVIAWPYPSAGYGLQQSTNLNTTNWMAVTNAPVAVGDEWRVTLTVPTQIFVDPETGDPTSYGLYLRLKKSGP